MLYIIVFHMPQNRGTGPPSDELSKNKPILRNKPEELNSLQTALLAFAKFGLTTPYDLVSQAGMSVGLTSPAFKRLEEAGLLEGVPGPRKRIEYVLTPKGEDELRSSLESARTNYWRIGRFGTFEAIPRAVLLLWIYLGKDDALRCLAWATEELRAQAQKKQRELEDLKDEMRRFQGDLFQDEFAAEEGLLIGTAYRYLKASSDATLLTMQAAAVEETAPLLENLPKSLQRLKVHKKTKESSR